MEVNSISDYLKPNMPLPQYLPYARFLLDTDLSHTAKLLYTLLLDRATLSQKNNWHNALSIFKKNYFFLLGTNPQRINSVNTVFAIHSIIYALFSVFSKPVFKSRRFARISAAWRSSWTMTP